MHFYLPPIGAYHQIQGNNKQDGDYKSNGE